MEIKTIYIHDIVPYDKNPRINDHAVDAVAESIQEFGFKVPIVIDSKKVIVTGHTRLKAAEQLGMKEVPCIIADDLTEEQVKAFRLADNKVGELADWDFSLLESELDDIGTIDMELFGFDFDSEGESVDVQEDDDFDNVILNETKTALGDLYRLGRHRLMCGDATSVKNIEKLTGGGGML